MGDGGGGEESNASLRVRTPSVFNMRSRMTDSPKRQDRLRRAVPGGWLGVLACTPPRLMERNRRGELNSQNTKLQLGCLGSPDPLSEPALETTQPARTAPPCWLLWRSSAKALYLPCSDYTVAHRTSQAPLAAQSIAHPPLLVVCQHDYRLF